MEAYKKRRENKLKKIIADQKVKFPAHADNLALQERIHMISMNMRLGHLIAKILDYRIDTYSLIDKVRISVSLKMFKTDKSKRKQRIRIFQNQDYDVISLNGCSDEFIAINIMSAIDNILAHETTEQVKFKDIHLRDPHPSLTRVKAKLKARHGK